MLSRAALPTPQQLSIETLSPPRLPQPRTDPTHRGTAEISLGDALELYEEWPAPKVIVSDGPYGLRSFPGDPPSVAPLVSWYRPHVEAWSRGALPSTTLWFWCSELGWATVHPLLELAGWQYVRACIWDKGPGHVAGNANSKTLRQLPAVTEVCVQYVRRVDLPSGTAGEPVPMKAWLRAEWQRSGLPLALTNKAAGVKNAATRKWFTQCHLWYAPTGGFVERLADYANRHGDQEGAPYFTLDGASSVTAADWDALRATFHCPPDVHNVWRHPPVRGGERLKVHGATAHVNQKPLKLVRDTILWSSNPGDVVWEPFGGLCTAMVAAVETGRHGHAAEVNSVFHGLATTRLEAVSS